MRPVALRHGRPVARATRLRPQRNRAARPSGDGDRADLNGTGPPTARSRRSRSPVSWHRSSACYLRPDPQGQRSLRPTLRPNAGGTTLSKPASNGPPEARFPHLPRSGPCVQGAHESRDQPWRRPVELVLGLFRQLGTPVVEIVQDYDHADRCRGLVVVAQRDLLPHTNRVTCCCWRSNVVGCRKSPMPGTDFHP